MWDTEEVQLSIRLPKEIAAQARELQGTDPEFLNQIVLYGLTRRSIYDYIRKSQERETAGLKG